MLKIHREGNVVAYVNNNKEVNKYMPKDLNVLEVKLTATGRKLLYSDGKWYFIEKVDKVFGVKSGEICQICRRGVLVDYGGCSTCPECNSQLKCGL